MSKPSTRSKCVYVCIPPQELQEDKHDKIGIIRLYLEHRGVVPLFSLHDPHCRFLTSCEEIWLYGKAGTPPESHDFNIARALIFAFLHDLPLRYFYFPFTPRDLYMYRTAQKQTSRQLGEKPGGAP